MRPTWDETWMRVADAIAERSLCERRKAGCVLVSPDNQLLAAGYNGPPAGYEAEGPCGLWCPRAISGGSMSYDDCPSVHAEPNALMRVNRDLLWGGTAYVTSGPCLTCAKNLSNSGISRVKYRITEVDRDRQPELSIDLFRRCGVLVTVIENRLHGS